MARVHQKKANKDYPTAGIKKGDMYYTWTLRPGGRGRGTKYRSLTPPKPQQLTNSDFYRQVYDLQDQLEGLCVSANWRDTPDDIVSSLDSIKSDIENLRDETQEKLDNMPEGLQQGPTGELLQQRVDGCDNWISELDGLSDAPEYDADDKDTTDDDFKQQLEDWVDEYRNCQYSD